ncbi:MAG TPA: enoyl-CoA hydratase-related protein [Bacillota bacterium]|nr:enoyl-CoA hydratase-related protein [Bacillota bacterium]
MTYQAIQLIKAQGVATVTINRPPMNPLNGQVFSELCQAVDDLQADAAVKAVIITGAGDKAFAAGADITEMIKMTPVEAYYFGLVSRMALEKLENLGKPVIAAINGLALGGGFEVALACDFRLASETAKFALPEINLGIIPGAGGTQRLSRLIGAAQAKELIFLGDMIDAATAKSLGAVHRVVPAETLMEEAGKLAAMLAAKPAIAIKMAKSSVNTGINLDISSALTLEMQNFLLAFASDDRKEGMQAFVEKRRANFTDK